LATLRWKERTSPDEVNPTAFCSFKVIDRSFLADASAMRDPKAQKRPKAANIFLSLLDKFVFLKRNISLH
jgi:hypothetical protein